ATVTGVQTCALPIFVSTRQASTSTSPGPNHPRPRSPVQAVIPRTFAIHAAHPRLEIPGRTRGPAADRECHGRATELLHGAALGHGGLHEISAKREGTRAAWRGTPLA